MKKLINEHKIKELEKSKIKGTKLQENDKQIFKNLQAYGEGYVFESYKDMCERLGLEIVGGNAKLTQMKNLQRFGVIKRNGRKWEVEIFKLYNTTKIKKVKKDARYIPEIEQVLLKIYEERKQMQLKENEILVFSKDQLLYSIGMINDSFLDTNLNLNKLLFNSETKKYISNINKKIVSILHKELNSLLRRNVIALQIQKGKNRRKIYYIQIKKKYQDLQGNQNIEQDKNIEQDIRKLKQLINRKILIALQDWLKNKEQNLDINNHEKEQYLNLIRLLIKL